MHARSAFSGKANPIAQDNIESHFTNIMKISPEGTYTLQVADELGAAITYAKELRKAWPRKWNGAKPSGPAEGASPTLTTPTQPERSPQDRPAHTAPILGP